MKRSLIWTLPLVVAAGCSAENNTEQPADASASADGIEEEIPPSVDQTFQASVTESGEELVVEVLNGEYRPSADTDTYRLMAGGELDSLPVELEEGSFVEVTYDGQFEPGETPGISVRDVTEIDAPVMQAGVRELGPPLTAHVFDRSFLPEEGTSSYEVQPSEGTEELAVVDENGNSIPYDDLEPHFFFFEYEGSSETAGTPVITTNEVQLMDGLTFEARMTDLRDGPAHYIEILDGEPQPARNTSWYRIIESHQDYPVTVYDEEDQEITLDELEKADVVTVNFAGGFEDSEPQGMFVHEIHKREKPVFQATVEETGENVTISIPDGEYRPSEASTYHLTGSEQNLVVFDEAGEETTLDELEAGDTVEVTYEGRFEAGEPASIYAHTIEVKASE
ncbi:hypothetical protein [Alkalicoccus urumqiensis]|uniref:DUF5666 domain-containing protein n=1 Tax=Alkalicoccus urumqiensis TaxID=1548213 RepID=A0A2P6MDZ5_ALKUR|nr:hypothetical protein [Alkalicoccus urumqiensis]PRO64502.1 hypothetical protein C6I21_14340 [Alkalicoccus urumqiensis]